MMVAAKTQEMKGCFGGGAAKKEEGEPRRREEVKWMKIRKRGGRCMTHTRKRKRERERMAEDRPDRKCETRNWKGRDPQK